MLQTCTSYLRKSPITLGLLTGLAVCLFFTAASAHAATLYVNSPDDTTTQADNACTLREAILNINAGTDTTSGDCAAADGSSDKIVLPAGRIELTSDLPTITASLTVEGEGMGETVVDGNGIALIFGTTSPGVSLTFQDFTITGFRKFAIDSQNINNILVRRVEINGTGAVPSDGVLTAIGNQGATSSLVVEDTYIHGLDGTGSQITAAIFVGAGGGSSPAELTVNRTTIADITSDNSTIGIGVIAGYFTGGTEGSANINVTNTTIYNIASTDNTPNSVAGGIVTNAMLDDSNSGENTFNLNLRNNTLVEVNHGSAGGASEILFVAGAVGADEVITVNLNASNNLLSSNNGVDCGAADITGSNGGAGTVNFNATSGGGNIAAGSTCAFAFTDLLSDQNNIGNFSSTLGPLTNNGGYVPTMALLPGSPAIDAGVTLSGVLTDARGVARPQDSPYDTGAYEVSPDSGIDSGNTSSSSSSSQELANTGENLVLSVMAGLGMLAFGCVALRRLRYS